MHKGTVVHKCTKQNWTIHCEMKGEGWGVGVAKKHMPQSPAWRGHLEIYPRPFISRWTAQLHFMYLCITTPLYTRYDPFSKLFGHLAPLQLW
jgi:hypothetical protein